MNLLLDVIEGVTDLSYIGFFLPLVTAGSALEFSIFSCVFVERVPAQVYSIWPRFFPLPSKYDDPTARSLSKL